MADTICDMIMIIHFCISENVNFNIDAKCNVQSFNSLSAISDEYDYCQLSIYLSFACREIMLIS